MVVAVLAAASSAHAAPLAGINAHVLWSDVDAAQAARQLDAVKAAGADFVEIDAGWSSLQETGPNGFSSWHLGRLDNVVNQARSRGLRVVITLLNSPCWASSAPEDLKQGCVGSWWQRGVDRYGPTNPADYARAVGSLASRYRGRVMAWEVWNEPNHADFFKGPERERRYVELVRAAYPAIKRADPASLVIAGAISECDTVFVEKLFTLGISGYFDAFSVHPYSQNASPLDPRWGRTVRTSFIRGVPAIRAIMVRYGSTKPMWLTEFGWSTSTVRDPYAPWNSGVSESDQATYLEQAVTQATSWGYVGGMAWYNLRNNNSVATSLYGNYGLLRYDWSAKPAYAAFKRAAQKLHL